MITFDREQVWRVIDAQWAGLADLLAGLTDEQWRQPSLCTGWTVRDVAAHLTMQQMGPGTALGSLIRWQGTLDRTVQYAACRRAAQLTTGQLVDRIRGTIGSHRHNFGVTRLETLIDVLVHSQDIAVPLGVDLPLPADAAAVATNRLLTSRWPPPLPSARKLAGFQLVATDTDFTAGTGPQVTGPAAALLLVCAGRLVALPRLSGPGAAALTTRLTGEPDPA
jgi:uncharacterized protein (TIGR03083 family)